MSTGIVRRLAKQKELQFVSLETELSFLDKRQLPEAAKDLFIPKGYLYGGFTSYPANFDISIMPQCRSMLIVRDPRDMLVSLYYSMKFSHPLPKEASSRVLQDDFKKGRQYANEADIDSFVLAAMSGARAYLSSYARILSLPTLKMFRYEDVVYRKREWVEEICDHFQWSVKRTKRDAIADSFDVFPTNEDRHSHIRQVHPGNFKHQLREATIQKIEGQFQEEMRTFGYQPSGEPTSADTKKRETA